MQDGLFRLVLLAKRINSQWHFDVANSHHRNPLMLLGVGAEFVWEGYTVQHAGEELGRGWGEVLQEAEEAFSALEELFATWGPTLLDFCRDWCIQHAETLWGKNVLHEFSFQDFSILLAEQLDSLCAHSAGSLLLGRTGQKYKISVQISLLPKAQAHKDRECCTASSQLCMNSSLAPRGARAASAGKPILYLEQRSAQPGNERGRY